MTQYWQGFYAGLAAAAAAWLALSAAGLALFMWLVRPTADEDELPERTDP